MRIGRETRPADESGSNRGTFHLVAAASSTASVSSRARRTLCELVHERDVHVTVDILDTLRGRRRLGVSAIRTES